MRSMGDHGSPYHRFQMAVETGSPLLIVAAAHELPTLTLDDALTVLAALAREGHRSYSRAAAKWVALATLERRLDTDAQLHTLTLARALPRTPSLLEELRRIAAG